MYIWRERAWCLTENEKFVKKLANWLGMVLLIVCKSLSYIDLALLSGSNNYFKGLGIIVVFIHVCGYDSKIPKRVSV